MFLERVDLITSWKVSNFKAIDEVQVDLTRINIVLGSNSIGKSSLLHSLLAAAQISEEKTNNRSTVSMIGYAIDLGGPSEVIHKVDSKITNEPSLSRVELTGKYTLPAKSRSFTNTMCLGQIDYRSVDFQILDNYSIERVSTGLDLKLVAGDSGRVDFSFIHSSGRELHFASLNQATKFSTEDFRLAEWADQVFEISYLAWLGEAKNSMAATPRERNRLRAEFAKVAVAFFSLFFEAQTQPASQEDRDILAQRFLNIRHQSEPRLGPEKSEVETPLSFHRDEMLSMFRAISPSSKYFGLFDINSQTAFWVSNMTRQFEFSRLHDLVLYLGPLRVASIGDQINRKSPSVLVPAGRQGEHLPHLLMTRGEEVGSFPMPDGTEKEVTLIRATNEWLKFFTISGSLRSEPVQGLTTKIRLGKFGLNQLGTGVSQILPVIVLSLLGTQGNGRLVMIEQPELHLHPDLQRALADFFSILSRTKARFLIETHSEYLVTRLRLLAAKGSIAKGDLSLIFAEKSTPKKSHSAVEYTQVPIDELGRSDYWPKDFFSNALGDRYELSAIQMMSVTD